MTTAVRGAAHARAECAPVDIAWPEIVHLVRKVVRRLAGPRRDLDDLTQAVLEQVVRGLERFEGRAEVSTFVYRVAAHVVMNESRWWRRWLRRFQLGADPGAWEPDAPSEGSSPEASLCARERADRIRGLLGALDAKSRMVLILVDMEELPASRVAEILECPEPTVRSRLRTARRRLADLVRRDPVLREELAR